MFYSIGPWIWENHSTEPHWRAPAGAVGLVDLRTNAQSSQKGTVQGFGFFATTSALGSGYVAIGQADHFGHEAATEVHKSAWESATGFRPNGALLSDLLWDYLTRGADPSGQAECKPLMPGVEGTLELYLGGHSLIRQDRFNHSHKHWNKVRDCLRRQFRGLFEQANGRGFRTRRGVDREQHLRVLDYWCKKYRVSDWRDLVPADLRPHVPGRLPHETTITDNFNRTDAASLGTSSGGWSWTELAPQFGIASNEATHTGGSVHFARAESDLSADDHYAQLLQTGTFSGERAFGTCARFDPSSIFGGHTCYSIYYYSGAPGVQINKFMSGVQTSLDVASATPGASETWKLECNGSSIKGYQSGVELASATDTDITGFVRTGLIGYGATTGDNFEAADLAAPPTGNRRRRVLMGAA